MQILWWQTWLLPVDGSLSSVFPCAPLPQRRRDLFSFWKDSAYNQLIHCNWSLWPSLTTKLNCSRSVVQRGLNIILFLLSPPSGIWSLKIKRGISFLFLHASAVVVSRYFSFSEMRNLLPEKLHWQNIFLESTIELKILPPPSPPVGYSNDHFHVLSCDWKENEQECKAWLMKQEQAEGDLSSSEIQSLSKSPNME